MNKIEGYVTQSAYENLMTRFKKVSRELDECREIMNAKELSHALQLNDLTARMRSEQSGRAKAVRKLESLKNEKSACVAIER